jgi:hypothetical protein
MNTINKLTFRALVALAVAVLFQTSLTRADEPGKAGEESQGAAKITFTKYVNSIPNLPGLMATVKGVGEGDAGDFLFEGEVFKTGGPRPPGQVVAMYHINGTKHSLSVLIEGLQPVGGIGGKGTIVGVVVAGWLKGHAVEGGWTVIPATYAPGTGFGNSFEVTLNIKKGVND